MCLLTLQMYLMTPYGGPDPQVGNRCPRFTIHISKYESVKTPPQLPSARVQVSLLLKNLMYRNHTNIRHHIAR